MAEEKKEKKGFFKRFKKLIFVLSGSIITLVIVTTVTVVILLSDKSRFSGKIVSDNTVEVTKKNYIEGFKDSKSTGKFTFQIPEEDFNSIYNKGSKSIKNNYVEQIYYGRGENKHHYFYIDLNLPIITSRVVIDTVAKESKDLTIKLAIEKVSLGKVNAYKFIKDKGILTSNFFNDFFKTCDVPITFNEKNNTFTVKPLEFLDNFPNTSNISTTFFKMAKDIGSPVIKIETASLGFTLDFSKFRSSSTLSAVDYSGELATDFNSELDTQLQSAHTLLTDDDPKTIYQISEDELSKALSLSISNTMKEEVTSSLTKQKVTNALVNIQANFINEDRMTLGLIYSFNGYLVDALVPLDFNDFSSDAEFNSYFEIQYEISIGSDIEEDIETNTYVQFFINNLRTVLTEYTSSSGLFDFDNNTDTFGLLYDDFTAYDSKVKTADKETSLDSESINFILTRI